MKNSLVYLTRDCPRKCEYCALRMAIGLGTEMSISDWKKAFSVLHKMDIEFNLILGNETWLLGNALLELMKANKVPYALYTTCPEPLFGKWKDVFFHSGVIDNLSCGIDYPTDTPSSVAKKDDSWEKSVAAWKGFNWVKKHFPDIDTQGTITVHKLNYKLLPKLVSELSELKVFIGINFIHWDSDGGFDFFPKKEHLKDFLFEEKDLGPLRTVLDTIIETPKLVQNPEFLKQDTRILTGMGWHCEGNPYSGPTVDADGSLRVCGYRKGSRTSKFSIFDLPEKTKEWQEAVFEDAMDCPGCCWSYPWMFHYWKSKNPELGKKVFSSHAGEHITKTKWSKRKIE